MAKQCAICNKRPVSGNSISHAHNATRRTWQPNVQRVRAFENGTIRRIWVCTRCLRSGKVQKPPIRTWKPEAEGEPSSNS